MADRDSQPRSPQMTSHENDTHSDDEDYAGSTEEGPNRDEAGRAVRALGHHEDEEERDLADDEESEELVE